MRLASDFRSIARDALRGRWGMAVIAGLIASLLGAASANGPELEFKISNNGAQIQFNFANQQIYSSADGWLPELNAMLVGGAVYILLLALIMGVGFFILGSIMEVGYARFNLDLVDRQKEAELGAMFGFFPYWKTTAMTNLIKTVYVLLWSLLLIIPGVIAAYSYAMTGYILADHPEMAPSEAIARSKEMMQGNRWRLFCLQLSFIGWWILTALTLGIGSLWLVPYEQASFAAFYRDISGTERMHSEYVPTV